MSKFGSDSRPAPLLCDVIMKGGITSGIVFPRALVELSRSFQFKNIGGTSAGAIAAAVAAAAELGRQTRGTSFESLDRLATELGTPDPGTGRSRLFSLFQPQSGTAALFDVATAALGGGWKTVPRVILAALRHAWLAALIGALPGAWLLWAFWSDKPLAIQIIGVAIGTSVLLAGAGLTTVGYYTRLISRRLPENQFGLCTGMPGATPATFPPLTVWLADYLDRTAGRAVDGPPLTFGDLWQTRNPEAERLINLEMMTTCLTHGRPYRLPLRDDSEVRENNPFFFHEVEFRALFPARVVQWMLDHPPGFDESDSRESNRQRTALAEKNFHPMPSPADLPVIVATRMSLSFPVLLSAIPLHAIDFSRREPDQLHPTCCWFSDGGICSNFPLHFFDSALPRWPTFAINLADKHPDYPAGVYLPKKNKSGLAERWNHFAAPGGLGAVSGFVSAILNTAKDWPDTLQSRLPGYRDRIATISLEAADGGLNLDMSAERMERLAGYGATAGGEFVRRFGPGPRPAGVDLTWENHRRIRLRATLAGLEELVAKLDESCASPSAGDASYEAILELDRPYPWRAAQRSAAAQLLAQVRALAQLAAEASISVADGAPRPRAELRVRPRT